MTNVLLSQRRGGLAAVVVALLALFVLAPASVARAHASLVGVDPANDTLVDTAPTEVTLTFTEPVDLGPDSVRVLDDDGVVRSTGATVEGDEIVVGLEPGLPNGTYTVSYSVISADSHPIGGVSVFHVGERTSAGLVDAAPSIDVAWGIRVGVVALTAVGYAGTMVAFGLAVLASRTRRLSVADDEAAEFVAVGRRWDRVALRAAVLAAVCLYASVPFRIARIGGGMDALRDNDRFVEQLTGPIGWAVGVTTLGLFALAVVIERRGTGSALAVPAGVVAAVGFTLEGHTRGTDPRWLMVGSDIVHVGAAGVWVGGLAGVMLVLRSPLSGAAAAGVVRRFSDAAVGAVAAMTIAGVVLAWRILRPDYRGLVDTGWGLALLTKVVLVVVVVALGAWNRRRLVSTVDAAGTSGRSVLRRIVSIELAVLATAIVVTGVLVTRSPVSSSAPAAPAPAAFTVALEPGGGTADVTVSPPRTGRVTFEMVVLDDEGRVVNPVATPELDLSFAELGIGPLDVELEPVDIGRYTGSVDLPYAGTWDVSVRVRVSDFESVAGTAVVEVDE